MCLVMANSRLGELLLVAAHEEDHRMDVNGVLARTRKWAWLVGARKVARKVVHSCLWCRRQGKLTAKQLMGDLPPEIARQDSPFTAVCLDLFGPLMAKGVGGHSRKVFKTWGVIFGCLGSKAVSIWLAPGYSKDDFFTCFEKQVAIYGLPKLVVSDQGSQLVAAGKELSVWGELGEEIAKQGVRWNYIPAGSQWRNGQAERGVAMAKHTLLQVVGEQETLSFVELEAALLKVAAILNLRPLDVRLYNDDMFHPICPRDLLLGNIAGYNPGLGEDWENVELESQLSTRLPGVLRVVKAWWARWEAASFLLLCPRQKWTREKRNLCEGDIVLIKWEKKLGKPAFRLAKVSRVLPDEKGVVRTVELALRSKRGTTREKPLQYKPVMEKVVLPVQRLVVLLPVEEAWQRGIARPIPQ